MYNFCNVHSCFFDDSQPNTVSGLHALLRLQTFVKWILSRSFIFPINSVNQENLVLALRTRHFIPIQKPIDLNALFYWRSVMDVAVVVGSKGQGLRICSRSQRPLKSL